MIRLKTPEQIDQIRVSCRLLARMFREIEPLVQPGVTPLELDAWAHEFILKNGGKPAFKGYQGFPATLCTSVNQAVIHGIPNNRALVEGDLIGIDCGINLNGFFSDMAVTFAVGQVTPVNANLLQVTKQALEEGVLALKPGGRVRDFAQAVTRVVEPHRYGIVHQYCGHGVGFSQHEDPQVHNNLQSGPSPRLASGMVLAVEPMINLGKAEVRVLSDKWTVVTVDGKNSAHFEYTVAVLDDRVEVLTV